MWLWDNTSKSIMGKLAGWVDLFVGIMERSNTSFISIFPMYDSSYHGRV